MALAVGSDAGDQIATITVFWPESLVPAVDMSNERGLGIDQRVDLAFGSGPPIEDLMGA